MPVIDIYDLEKAIEIQFGKEILANCEMRQLLFGDRFMNDVYIRHYFDDDIEYHGYSWENENEISVLNLINQFLRDEFPGQESVLINVSW
jgi:hypothetical protein